MDRSGSHVLLNPGLRKTLRILDIFPAVFGGIHFRGRVGVPKLFILKGFHQFQLIRTGFASGVERLLIAPAMRLVGVRGEAG
jgi:hypothetical protein